MSFSYMVKEEILSMQDTAPCCREAERFGMIRAFASFAFDSEGKGTLYFLTENLKISMFLENHIEEMTGIRPVKSSRLGKCRIQYDIRREIKEFLEKYLIYVGESVYWYEQYIPGKKCCRAAYLRGAFLAVGSINDPERGYHLEMAFSELSPVEEFHRLIVGYKLNAGVVDRKKQLVIYIKDGENIISFLTRIGAAKSMMKMTNIMIMKDVRNNINRVINCESANIQKTVNASVRQTECIKILAKSGKIETLSENLKETAEMRLRYPEMSLTELGAMMTPPVGRSGMNHRLRKLEKLSRE